MHQNEIRDYLESAPKRWRYDGHRMINNTGIRLRWLSSIAAGTLNERINRRAGIVDLWCCWKMPPALSAQRRHHRRQMIIKLGRRK